MKYIKCKNYFVKRTFSSEALKYSLFLTIFDPDGEGIPPPYRIKCVLILSDFFNFGRPVKIQNLDQTLEVGCLKVGR